jgi:hypothetical protein
MPFVCYNPSMSESSRQVDPSEFERLVRDGLANLYDQAALATHPLAALASGQPETAQSKGKQLRITLTEIIEGLRPLGAGEPAGEPDPSAPTWFCGAATSTASACNRSRMGCR